MIQYFIAVLVIIVTAIGGFTLPYEALKWQDQKRLENSETQDAEEVILSAGTDMTLIEKMQLMQKPSVTSLSMEQGKNYSRDSIIVKAQKEIQNLMKLGLLNLDAEDAVYGIEDVLFLVDTEDGTKSMILWNVSVITGDFFLGISMDDESGKILNFRQLVFQTAAGNQAEVSEEFSISEKDSGELETAAEKWGDYLGISLTETYDTLNPTEYMEKKQVKDIGCQLYGVYEDAGGTIAYLFRKNTGDIVFSAKFFG